MIAVFQTEAFGQIEINTETRTAYFKGQDYEATIEADWTFRDNFGIEFQAVLALPFTGGGSSYLQVRQWRTIGVIS